MERDLKKIAVQTREEILDMVYKAKSGHIGGSFSAVEILLTLYSSVKIDPSNPKDEMRDRVVISKGHATPVLYSVLSTFDFFSKKELEGFRKIGRILQGHAYKDVPGIEVSTGSLGQGLSYSVGLALAGRLKKSDYRVYCILGDGELQEGSIWEGAMSAGVRKLSHLCAVVDYNKVQENGFVNKIKDLEPLKEKWESFGWKVKVVDGHNIDELLKAFEEFKEERDKPFCIIANTVKGKGVSFMEFNNNWHGKAPNEEEYIRARKELEKEEE